MFIILLPSILFLSLFVTFKVVADEILPRISTVCESKDGSLTAFNDGFSRQKKCPKSSRRVVLIGEMGPTGSSGMQGIAGTTGATGPKGESSITIQSFYAKTYGPFGVDLANGTAVHMECNVGDVAVSGGLSYTEGDAFNWLTAKSGPSSTDQSVWDIFVTNSNFSKAWSFTTTINCLKLQ